MAANSKIEWTEQTWNPAVGCTKVSPGCAHCYAEVMARRLQAMGVKGYDNGFALTLLPERLEEPLHRKLPKIYFVNSMSDLFHEMIPDAYIREVFRVIEQAPQHTFRILTKRAERMAAFFADFSAAPSNAWLGTTEEDRRHRVPRLDWLRQVPARIWFVSAEPLLEDLGTLDLSGIH